MEQAVRERAGRFLRKLPFCAAAFALAGTIFIVNGWHSAIFAAKKEDPLAAEVRALMDANKIEEAQAKLAAALRNYPDDDNLRLLHADALYRLGRFHFAADETKKVLEQKPDNAEAVLLNGKALQSMRQRVQAIAAYKKFQSLKPDDPRSQQYAALISVLESEEAQSAKKKSTASGDNYLAAVAGSNLLSWKTDAPISVYVKDGTGVEGYRADFEESLRQAFDEWSEATDGKLRFDFIQDPSIAKMTVTWTNDLHAPELTPEAGLAKTSFGTHGIENAEILLLTVDPLKDGPLGKNRMFNTCLHEIGHALGLQGHSPHEDDIMSSQLSVQQGLSPRDIRTINALYGEKSGQTRQLPDKDEYGRPLPATVICERHVQEGYIAASNYQYEKAVAEFEAALKIDPKNEKARESIAISLNNMAIENDTHADKAIELFRNALFWDPAFDAARKNLNASLHNKGIEPASFDMRIKLAEQCLAKHDTRGAIVEYTEALIYKADEATKKKRDALQAELRK
jgi:tetratricopeptide (TPR) repeat protein